MQDVVIQYSASSFWIFAMIGISILTTVISSKNAKKAQEMKRQNHQTYPVPPNYGQSLPPRNMAAPMQSQNHGVGNFGGGNQGGNYYQRAEFDTSKLNEQTRRYMEADHSGEASYRAEEEFRRKSDVFYNPVPDEQFVTQPIREEVTEYVPEEFGESNYKEDTFYKNREIRSALQDAEDIAREKAYRKGKEYQSLEERRKNPKLLARIMSQKPSFKKAIILSEIMSEPKGMRE